MFPIALKAGMLKTTASSSERKLRISWRSILPSFPTCRFESLGIVSCCPLKLRIKTRHYASFPRWTIAGSPFPTLIFSKPSSINIFLALVVRRTLCSDGESWNAYLLRHLIRVPLWMNFLRCTCTSYGRSRVLRTPLRKLYASFTKRMRTRCWKRKRRYVILKP